MSITDNGKGGGGLTKIIISNIGYFPGTYIQMKQIARYLINEDLFLTAKMLCSIRNMRSHGTEVILSSMISGETLVPNPSSNIQT